MMIFFFRLVCLHFCGVGKHGVSAGARVEAAATLRSRGRHNRFMSNYRAFPREVKKTELLTHRKLNASFFDAYGHLPRVSFERDPCVYT